MKSIMKWALISIAAASLVACGKSDGEKAKDNADSRIAELKSLASEVDGRTPDASWTDAELNEHEVKINRISLLARELQNLDGRDDLVIWGADFDGLHRAVESHRQAIATARAEKLQNAGTEEKLQELKALAADLNSNIPQQTWSEEQLNAQEAKVNRAQSLVNDLRYKNNVRGDFAAISSVLDGYKVLISSIRENKAKAGASETDVDAKAM